MDEARARDTGRLALAVGAVAAGSAACLATFFVVGQPFGTINDIGNATAAVLSGWLAWRLRGQVRSRCAPVAVGAALVGAGISVVGSALVVSGTTGLLPRRARVEPRVRRHRRVARRREPERGRRDRCGHAALRRARARRRCADGRRHRGGAGDRAPPRRHGDRARRGSGSASSAGSGCTSSTRPGRSGWGSSRRGGPRRRRRGAGRIGGGPMTDWSLIALRIVHVGAAMVWFGGAIIGGFFLAPDGEGARSVRAAVHGSPHEAPSHGDLLPDRVGADDPRRRGALLAGLERARCRPGSRRPPGWPTRSAGSRRSWSFVGGIILVGPSIAEQTAVQNELAAGDGVPTATQRARLERADRRMQLANRFDLPLLLLAG